MWLNIHKSSWGEKPGWGEELKSNLSKTVANFVQTTVIAASLTACGWNSSPNDATTPEASSDKPTQVLPDEAFIDNPGTDTIVVPWTEEWTSWLGNQVTNVDSESNPEINDDDSVALSYPTCENEESDPDWDGFGFEDWESCIVKEALSNQSIEVNDQPVESWVQVDADMSLSQSEIDRDSNYRVAFAVAWQSNALWIWTPSNGRWDSPVNNIWALQSDSITMLPADQRNQDWLQWWVTYPGAPWLTNSALVKEIWEGLVEKDSDIKVWMAATGSPGESIDHWAPGTQAYSDLVTHLKGLKNATWGMLEFNKLIISWHQWETDHGSDKIVYSEKVYDLIARLTRDIGIEIIFIGNSTPAKADERSMNSVYAKFAEDGNPNTCYVDLSDLVTEDGTHFDNTVENPSIDMAGRRIAAKIWEIINGNSTTSCD